MTEFIIAAQQRRRRLEKARELVDCIGDRMAKARARSGRLLGDLETALQPVRTIAARLESGSIETLTAEHGAEVEAAFRLADDLLRKGGA